MRFPARLIPPALPALAAAALLGAALLSAGAGARAEGAAPPAAVQVAAAPAAPVAAPAAPPDASAAAVEVRVLPHSEVTGSDYTLGEVAELDGPDLAVVRRLAALSLGRSPLPGRSQRLSESYVRARLNRATDGVPVTVIVPQGAEVVRASQVVSGEDVGARVLAKAAEEAKADGLETEQELSGRLSDVVLPMGEVTWEIEPRGRRLSAGGARTFQVVARVNGEEAWRTMVHLRQKAYRTIVVAVHNVRRNQVIAAGDVTLARKSVVGMKDETYLTRLKDAVGARAKRPIGRGEWVHKGLLVPRTDVAEGGPVTLVYRTDSLHFATPGVALVPAKVGQFIPVRNLDSGRIVYGVVESGDTVNVK